MQKYLLNCVSFIVAGQLMMGATFADENSKEIIVDAYILDELSVTENRTSTPMNEMAGNVALLKADELELVKGAHISQMLNRVSGVNFSRNNGQEYLASIRSPIFTGAGACGAFLMAQDSVNLRAAGFCNVNELFEASTEMAERIEIIKGAGSALFGSNALHGIINVITPAANVDETEASFEGGSYGFLRLNATKSIAGDKHGFRIMGSVSHDGGYRDDSGFNQQKLNLRHDYEGSEWTVSSKLSLTNLNQETAGYITGLESYKNSETSKINPNPEAYRKAKSLRFSSEFSVQINDDIRWQFTPYLRALDMEFLMHFLPGQPVEENSQSSVGFQNGFYYQAAENLEITAGIDGEYTKGSLTQTQENPTEGSLFLTTTIPTGKQYDYDVDIAMIAAFLQGNWDVTPELSLRGGVRLEHMNYDYTNNMVSGRTDADGNICGFGGCRYSRPESRSDDFTTFSPNVSMLYNFYDLNSFYIKLSHGFRAPQATELYRLQRAQTVAALETVSLKNFEIGVKGKEGVLKYNLSLYWMKKDGFIFRDSSYYNVDNGKSKHFGVDLMVGLEITEEISLQGNMSFAHHRYDFDYISNGINLNGKDIDTAPRHFGNVKLNWSPSDAFSGEFEWVHMGSYYLDPENLHQYEGHDYFNMRLNITLNKQVGLFVRVLNLTNVRYAERADYTRFTDERYFPGKPRSYFAGVEIHF